MWRAALVTALTCNVLPRWGTGLSSLYLQTLAFSWAISGYFKSRVCRSLSFLALVQSDPVSLFPNPIWTWTGLTCEPIPPFHSALTPFQMLETFPCLLELTGLHQLAGGLRCCIQGRDELTFWKTDITLVLTKWSFIYIREWKAVMKLVIAHMFPLCCTVGWVWWC